MSFVICLCHFCDSHGPSVLQTCYATLHHEEHSSESNDITCEACSMPHQFISTERATGMSCVSCRLPTQHSLSSWLTHACVRSLSCELNPCVISEPPLSALSVSFNVRDAWARGFYRWFTVVVSSRDLPLLAASWPFLSRNIQSVIEWLQNKATQVYNVERPFRGSETAQSRSLTQLVKYKAVYARLHCWFSWMILACHSRLTERIPRSPYYRFQAQHVFEEGNLKSLQVFLGRPVFELAALNVLEGRQVIIRGDIPALVQATVNTLKNLLPGDWSRAMPDCDQYLEPSQCSLLGVGTEVAVPRPCEDIVRVDMVQGIVSAKTTATMPAKCPSLVNKIIKAVGNDLLREKALAFQLQSLYQEWTHIAKLVHLTRSQNSTALLASLGVKPQDHQLIEYWSRNLFKS